MGCRNCFGGLQTHFDFPLAVGGTLTVPGPVPNLAVWQLEGHWKTARLSSLLPKQQAAIAQGRPADLSKLPEHLPDRVVLLLGRKICFPSGWTIIVHALGDPATGDGRMLTMELLDIDLTRPFRPSGFSIIPARPRAPT